MIEISLLSPWTYDQIPLRSGAIYWGVNVDGMGTSNGDDMPWKSLNWHLFLSGTKRGTHLTDFRRLIFDVSKHLVIDIC